MILEEGDIINLNQNGKNYMVISQINNGNKNYYYLMSAEKPVEVQIVTLLEDNNGEYIVETVTDENEINTVMQLTAQESKNL